MINPLRRLLRTLTGQPSGTSPRKPAARPVANTTAPLRLRTADELDQVARIVAAERRGLDRFVRGINDAHDPARAAWVDIKVEPRPNPTLPSSVPAAIECGPEEMVRRINEAVSDFEATNPGQPEDWQADAVHGIPHYPAFKAGHRDE